MGNLIKEIVKAAASETAGKVVDAYSEAKRLEHEKEIEKQKIEEEKRKSRRPIMICLIVLSVIGLVGIWFSSVERIGQLLATIILVPLIIYFINKL